MSELPEHTRLAVRTEVGIGGRHYLIVRMEVDGRRQYMSFECQHDPGDVEFVWGGGLARVGGFEIVERDWMAA